MSQSVAQILTQDPSIFDGSDIFAGTSGSLEPGVLVKFDSGGSTVSLSTSASVSGIAWGGRYATYRPTSQVFAAGEPMVIVFGRGLIQLSATFFAGGALPSPLDTIYAGANGLWSASGTVKVGKCIKVFTRTEPVGGVGVNQDTVLINYDIPTY
jgi:hypothetical protein